jgi:hypothetical protein
VNLTARLPIRPPISESVTCLLSYHVHVITSWVTYKKQFREPVAYPNIFSGGGVVRQEFFRAVKQIQLRTEGRENGDLGAIAP